MALSKEIKEALKKDFEAGEIPVTEIAKKHGVNPATIYRLEKKEKWDRKKRNSIAKPKPDKKPKAGRPTKYKPEYAKLATPLAMIGYTDEKIAEYFGTNRETLRQWKKRYPEFLGAFSDGRIKATAKVAVSLFQRACGYTHKEEKIFCQDGQIIRAETKKHYPPEYKCLALWLKNKEPKLWKDKQEIEGSMELKLGKITKEDVEIIEDFMDQITE